MKAIKFLAMLSFVLMSMYAKAHEIKNAFLSISENENGAIHIVLKHPIKIKLPTIQITAGWFKYNAEKKTIENNYEIEEWSITDTHAAISNQTLTVTGFEGNDLNLFAAINFKDGSNQTQLLTAANNTLHIEKKARDNVPIKQYIQLGIWHIWTGIDHLLFVFGLLLLVKGKRKLFFTITAFTLAHSITLALATMHIVQIAAAPVEAIIALSIMFLAIELLRHYKGNNGLTYHYPWIVAFTFGLLHGFGFAGALAEVGLPQKNIPFALVLFNVGVEVGQLIFVLVILTIAFFLQKPLKKLPHWSLQLPPYIIGGLASFWFIERVVAMFY